MKRAGKKILASLLALLLIFSLAACGGGASKDGDGEVIFNVAISGGYDTLNFFTTESSMVYDWLNIVYDSLITYDDEYNAIPRVAKDWTEENNVWTFHLRDDVYFSDGEQLTSADVKWTYEHAVDSYMYSLHASGFISIECPDDFTVVFNCENAKPDMLYQIIPILPEHIWSGMEDVLSYEPTELVGSGPFIYSPERSGSGSTAFVKNEEYWGDVPVVDVLVFTEYDNSDAIAQALKLGEVDAAYTLEKTQLDTLNAVSGIEAGAYASFGFEYLGYNLLDELCADKTIRHAIDYCVDRETVIEMSYGGLADVAYGAVNNDGFVYTPAEKRDLDIAKANELLDAAGYKDTDGDGIREKDGQKLSLEVISASDRSSWQSATVNMLITNCKQAGIEIVWNPMEKTAMWDTCYDGNPDWQLVLDGWGGDADPGFIMCLFQDYETLGYAGVSYQNPDFDAAYEGVYATADPAERAQYIEKCQEIVYEDCPYTFLCFDQTVQAINSAEWTGYKTNSHGLFGNELYYNYCHLAPAN